MMVEDRHGFLGPEIGNASHRPLLLLALEATKDDWRVVLEMGMGHGSTPFLHRYCVAERRLLLSLDNNQTWVDRFKPLDNLGPRTWVHSVHYDPKWAEADGSFSVVLVDHAPEERRHVDVEHLADKSAILVLHDTEPEATGYLYDRIWGLFKYRCNIEVPAPYAHAAAVSNVIDVTKWKGTTFPNYPYAVT